MYFCVLWKNETIFFIENFDAVLVLNKFEKPNQINSWGKFSYKIVPTQLTEFLYLHLSKWAISLLFPSVLLCLFILIDVYGIRNGFPARLNRVSRFSRKNQSSTGNIFRSHPLCIPTYVFEKS